MTDTPTISVVVPTRDRPTQLARCLAALEAQTAAAFEVIVVDDASLDAEAVAAVARGAPHAQLVRGGGRGPAAARNVGARHARAPIVCFTDDDCRPDPGWLDAVRGRIASGAEAVAGPTVNGQPGDVFGAASQTITNHLMEWSYDARSGAVAFAPTSNVACTAELIRALPFDERYPLAAGEDREWCGRLRERGVALVFEPTATVRHHQELSPARFWRQQVRYGRGARRWHRQGREGSQPVAFYTSLLRRGFAHGPRVGAAVVLAQLVTAIGIAAEAFQNR